MAEYPREVDGRADVVYTGHPLVALLACTKCGVLLWDVEKHWADAHSDTDSPVR